MEERLQKYMASCGVASRRKCEEIILAGKVKVNGVLVNELGTKVDPLKDVVEYEGTIISKEENKVYIMLNKPEGYISSVKDEKGRDTILDIVKVKERVYPIGRLDYDSSGLLLLTNDGEIYNKIIHPRVEIVKKYIAVVDGEITDNDIKEFGIGIVIDCKYSELNYIKRNILDSRLNEIFDLSIIDWLKCEEFYKEMLKKYNI